jgi:hypothetical protein
MILLLQLHLYGEEEDAEEVQQMSQRAQQLSNLGFQETDQMTVEEQLMLIGGVVDAADAQVMVQGKAHDGSAMPIQLYNAPDPEDDDQVRVHMRRSMDSYTQLIAGLARVGCQGYNATG